MLDNPLINDDEREKAIAKSFCVANDDQIDLMLN